MVPPAVTISFSIRTLSIRHYSTRQKTKLVLSDGCFFHEASLFDPFGKLQVYDINVVLFYNCTILDVSLVLIYRYTYAIYLYSIGIRSNVRRLFSPDPTPYQSPLLRNMSTTPLELHQIPLPFPSSFSRTAFYLIRAHC